MILSRRLKEVDFIFANAVILMNDGQRYKKEYGSFYRPPYGK
jgi:hypothetical protein